MDRIIHSEIPQSNLTVPASRDQLSQATTLHVDVGYPLLVLTPDLDHGCRRLEALVENTDRPISESCNEDVSGNLIRRQRSDA